jgi:hypothetical protein
MVWSSSSDWPPRRTTTTVLMKQHQQSNVNNDGNNGDGKKGNGNSDSNGNWDDAAATNNSYDVDEDNGGNLRTAIGQWQLDNDDGTTPMRWQWLASNMQIACKCCATHPRQQSTNVDSLGRSGLVQLLELAAKKHNNDKNYKATLSKWHWQWRQLVTMPLPLLWQQYQQQQQRHFEDGNRATAIGQQQWDDNNVMAMGGQQHAERLQVLCLQSKATVN